MTALTKVPFPPPPDGTPESEFLFEIVNGERVEIPHMGIFAGMLASILSQELGVFARQHRLGLVGVEVLFRFRPDRPSRRPDLAFVSYDRITTPAIPPSDPAEWEVVPNLTVEVISPSNTAEDVMVKLQDYFDAGVQVVWVIYPRQRWVFVYESMTQVRQLRETDELDGGKVLPGFSLKIADLFAALVKPTT
jgi:Uma2 family endonuclease